MGSAPIKILAGEPRAVPALARPAPWHLRWPWVVLTGDTHIEATRGWSMSSTRFDVAKYQRCRKGDAEANTIALPSKWLLCVALQGLSGHAPKPSAIVLAIRQITTIWSLSSRAPGLLSVTESFALPPKPKGGHVPNSRFDLREWLVPPVLMPIFLVLLVAAAMVIQW